MKKIVCLGTSIAGIKALAEIRKVDTDAQLTVFALEPFYPFRREALADFVAKDILEEKIYYQPKEFYKENCIECILDKRLARINFKRNQIVTEDKTSIAFDTLIISEPPQIKFPDLKGTNKAGVFSIRKLTDIKNILQVLPLVETAVIAANSIEGVQMACALRRRDKEVCLVFPTLSLLADILDQESAVVLMQRLEEIGIRLFYDHEIVKILGEGEVKAVRLKTKKVIAAQMLIFEDVSSDLRILADSPLAINQGIVVDAAFKTNLENVYALNGVCEQSSVTPGIFPGSEILEEQGKIVAASLSGQNYSAGEPVQVSRIKSAGVSVVLVGETKLKEGGREFLTFNPVGPMYKKILACGDFLTGAVLMNAENDIEDILRLIREKVKVTEKEEELLKREQPQAQVVR